MSEPTGVHALPPWARRPIDPVRFAPGVRPSEPDPFSPSSHRDPRTLESLMQPDPMHAAITEVLARTAATFDPGGRYECPVAGCDWALNVPPPELVEVPVDLERYTWHTRIVGAPREQVELAIVLHVDSHATGGAPPVEDPPDVDPWLEVDDHRDDEPEGWRTP